MKRYLAQEKGHGSATDMVRRKRVRQTSEREVGMLDMLLITSFAEEVSHEDVINKVSHTFLS